SDRRGSRARLLPASPAPGWPRSGPARRAAPATPTRVRRRPARPRRPVAVVDPCRKPPVTLLTRSEISSDSNGGLKRFKAPVPREVPMTSNSIGVALIGAGMVGRAHANAYRNAFTVFDTDVPPARLVAVADADG